MLHPLVSVLYNKQLVSVQVTKCDWCGARLRTTEHVADNAVRVLYFCTKACKEAFDARYPPNTQSYPSIKLTYAGLFVNLKEIQTCQT